MNYWLVKSEPSVFSWDQLVKDGEVRWDGVRNYAARNHLRGMKKGDEVFFYHSNEGQEIVGIAKVIKEAYQDPTTDNEAWVCVDLAPHKALKKSVTLAEMKKETALKNIGLIRIGRLSVMPLTKEEFGYILKMGR
jgi:predicted RNA-binding protein with PUA-like domain